MNPVHEYRWAIEKTERGIRLYGVRFTDGDEVNILEMDENGITLCDSSQVEGVASADVIDGEGNPWSGPVVHLDGTSITIQ